MKSYGSPPHTSLVFTLQYNIVERSKVCIENGVCVRGVVDFTYAALIYNKNCWLLARTYVISKEIKGYHGGSREESISSINIDFKNLSLDAPVVALWSGNPTYAEYLRSTFELAWQQAIPAAQRIEELLKEGPPNS